MQNTKLTAEISGEPMRAVVEVCGAVQGVGFRPFIFRLATALGLTGWVRNSASGVSLEIEGDTRSVAEFLRRIDSEKPPHAFIQNLEATCTAAAGYPNFEVRASDEAGPKMAQVLPDLATCADCLRDVFDPLNRRYQYPFTNCTNCGPRFSFIKAQPYDRASTTMRDFVMCKECRVEYESPRDRRFHAQPNACPVCGPELAFYEKDSGRTGRQGEGETRRQGGNQSFSSSPCLPLFLVFPLPFFTNLFDNFLEE